MFSHISRSQCNRCLGMTTNNERISGENWYSYLKLLKSKSGFHAKIYHFKKIGVLFFFLNTKKQL